MLLKVFTEVVLKNLVTQGIVDGVRNLKQKVSSSYMTNLAQSFLESLVFSQLKSG